MSRIALVFILTGMSSISFGYSGGTGTADAPYQIADANDLLELSADPNNYDKCFVLTADIDLQEQTFTTAIIAPDTDNTEWNGFQGTSFTGVFDGDGYTISNLTITANESDYVGLFGSVGAGGQIKNLSIVNTNVQGREYVGGLAGSNKGTITCCSSAGIVSSGDYVGGLCGENSYGTITFSCAAGAVSGTARKDEYSELYTSYGYDIGGLVGLNYSGTITSCYATGSVSGVLGVGGLIGDNFFEESICGCYAAGTVTGNSNVGGLIGCNISNFVNCYCFWDIQTSGQPFSNSGRGKTTAQMQDVNTFLAAGWDFVFETANGTQDIWTISPGRYPYFAWQADVSPDTTTVPDVVSMTQTDAQNVIIAAGLTVKITNAYSDTVAVGTVISQSPAAGAILLAGMFVNIEVSMGPYNPGSGTEADPYQIVDANDLLAFAADTGNYDKCFILMNDIDLKGQIFNIAIIAPDTNSSSSGFQGTKFTGTFDGNGHKITNFTITNGSGQYLGLFGAAAGQIKNLGIEDFSVYGYRYVGGLVGDAGPGNIRNCYTDGAVSGNSYIGGLVGSNACRIDNCYATGAVSGSNSVGGLIGSGGTGDTSGACDITNCYATGDVSGTENIGGLIGYNYYSGIRNCHSTGSVSGGGAGGLIGHNERGTISLCYSAGNVSGGGGIGGLIGYNGYGIIRQCYSMGIVSGSSDSWYVGGLAGYNWGGSIHDCYSTGAVSGTSSVGGLAGEMESHGTISTCYSTGNVTGSSYFAGGLVGRINSGSVSYCYATGAVSGNSYVGGLTGVGDSEDVVGSFWDTQTSGQMTSAGGEGKTTVEMKTLSTFTSAGWDFTSVWGMALGQYPELFIRQAGDLNLDTRVDMSDLMIFAQHWLEGM